MSNRQTNNRTRPRNSSSNYRRSTGSRNKTKKNASFIINNKVKTLAKKWKNKTKRTKIMSKLAAMRRTAVKKRNKLEKNKLLTSYRIEAINKLLNKTKHPNNENKFLNETFRNFVNPLLEPSFEAISHPDNSGSGSFVLLVNTNQDIQLVLKITKIPDEQVEKKHSALAEYEFYTIMKKLISHKITPHVFRSVARFPDEGDGNSFNSSKLGWPNGRIKELFKRKHIFVRLLETNMNSRSKINNFSNTIMLLNRSNKTIVEKIINNLFFEIMYTLVAFKKLKFKHNDLHLGNILIIHQEKNIYDDTLKGSNKNLLREYEFEYNGEKVNVLLPNTGVTARIFDFDRSCLISEKGNLRADNLLNKYGVYFQDCNDNFYKDTYKFILKFYDSIRSSKMLATVEVKKVFNSIMEFIESCFYQPSLLNKGTVTDEDGTEIIIDPGRMPGRTRKIPPKPDYIIGRPGYVSGPIDKYMKSPEDILFELSEKFPHKIDDNFVIGSNNLQDMILDKFSLLDIED